MNKSLKLRALALALTLTLCLGLGAPAHADLLGWLTGRDDAQPTLAPTATPDPGAIPESSLADDGLVRVYLKSMGDPERLDITFAGVYAVEDSAAIRFARDAQIALSAADGSVLLTAGRLTLNLGAAVTFTRHAAEEGAENGLRIGQSEKDTLYCGDLTVSADGGGLRPVLEMPVEEYLRGVVAYEMSDSFPVEALKAQAVAARTYVMQRKWSAGTRDYDVVDTTADQVFKGYDAQYTNVIAAVEATEGVVGVVDGGFARCYYTASNGGETALPSQVWTSADDDSYLAVTEDPYDLENPRSLQNELTVTPACNESGALKDMLTDALGSAMQEMGYWPADWRFESIAAIEPVNPRAPSKKWFDGLRFDLNVQVRALMVTPEPTATATPAPTAADAVALPWLAELAAAPEEPEDDMRAALEAEPRYLWVALDKPVSVTLDVYEQIKEGLNLGLNGGAYELISVETKTDAAGAPTSFKLVMRRFGHGVGMSQRGAQWMAGNYDKRWTEILAFYYPGVSFEHMTWTGGALTALDALPAVAFAPRATPAPTPTPAPLPSPEAGEYVARVALESADSTLNVREAPSIRGRVLGLLDNGREVLVAGEPDAEGWVAVRTAELSGYVKGEYLERE